MIFWIRVWQFVSHHWCPTSWFSLPCFLTSNWSDFLHEPTLVCLVHMWIFLELIVAFPNCLRFFSPVWSYVDFLWHMFSYHLWNSHTLLDEHEIWHVISRHLKLCHGFDPIHFSYAITVFMNYSSWCMFGWLLWVCLNLPCLSDFHWLSLHDPNDLKFYMHVLLWIMFDHELFGDFWKCLSLLLMQVLLLTSMSF
jgi:hypothetical protein